MTEEKNSKSDSEEQPKKERRFDPELLKKELQCDLDQYDRLIECSKKGPGGITEWNQWRDKNPAEEIWLQGADLWEAKLQGANLNQAKLQGANLWGGNLQGAKFIAAILNGSTNLLKCKIDKNTDFHHTALENMLIESGTKTLLKYNIRRMNWRDWYENKRFLQWPVKLFWSISNYGISTLRIIVWFFGLALFFAAVYSNLACWWDIQAIGGSGEGFTVEPRLPLLHYSALIILRPIYFSVVTMTTLGFGDMFANAQSIWGHILLTLQVILGYVLLGALVTRLAVLFTSDGPAGSFTPMDKETKELLAKLKEDKGS